MSDLIIETLENSANALARQDKHTAIASMEKIISAVNEYKRAAEKSEIESKAMHTSSVVQINALIQQQAKAHAECDKAKAELDQTYSKIASLKVSIKDIDARMERSRNELNGLRDNLRQSQARIDDLNDDSALSIIASIASFGLDRAIKAISIEIDDVRGKINTINNAIAAYSREQSDLSISLHNDNVAVEDLNKVVNEKNKLIKSLDFLEFKLHNKEDILRKRLVFFTEVNLFYIKVQNLISNVENRIEDVYDIVKELDNETPTIACFDPSSHDLISLRAAITLFGDYLEKKISFTSFEPIFDENKWYRISCEWLGEKWVVDGTKSSPSIADNADVNGQLWKVKALGGGYFRLTHKRSGDKKSLDVFNDDVDNKVVMADTGNYTGQFWKIDPEFGYFRLSTHWLGENRSLSVSKEGTQRSLIMEESGNYSNQHWRFVPA